MADIFDVANYILKISRDNTGDEDEEEDVDFISNMKLQKLVYFCQGFFLALCGKPLFPETIEAWKHGPVCPRLYQPLKIFGASPITASIDPEKISLTEQERSIINMVYSTYRQYSSSGLRKITHNDGPWKTTKIGTEISQKIMLQYFESLVEAPPKEIPLLSESEKYNLVKILEQAEANGEIDLSRFCVPMGT